LILKPPPQTRSAHNIHFSHWQQQCQPCMYPSVKCVTLSCVLTLLYIVLCTLFTLLMLLCTHTTFWCGFYLSSASSSSCELCSGMRYELSTVSNTKHTPSRAVSLQSTSSIRCKIMLRRSLCIVTFTEVLQNTFCTAVALCTSASRCTCKADVTSYRLL
jgi:hypothetical protein